MLNILCPLELRKYFRGKPLALEDMKKHTLYENCQATTPLVVMFWEVLAEFSAQEMLAFLEFTTGLTKVPLAGFQSLQFTVKRVALSS